MEESGKRIKYGMKGHLFNFLLLLPPHPLVSSVLPLSDFDHVDRRSAQHLNFGVASGEVANAGSAVGSKQAKVSESRIPARHATTVHAFGGPSCTFFAVFLQTRFQLSLHLTETTAEYLESSVKARISSRGPTFSSRIETNKNVMVGLNPYRNWRAVGGVQLVT